MGISPDFFFFSITFPVAYFLFLIIKRGRDFLTKVIEHEPDIAERSRRMMTWINVFYRVGIAAMILLALLTVLHFVTDQSGPIFKLLSAVVCLPPFIFCIVMNFSLSRLSKELLARREQKKE